LHPSRASGDINIVGAILRSSWVAVSERLR
jgi:hypothetical protein